MVFSLALVEMAGVLEIIAFIHVWFGGLDEGVQAQ